MTTLDCFKQGLMLEEGKYYSFRYIKLVTLEDHKEYMILEDPYGIRHTVYHAYYSAYSLQIMSYIMCKVEKINCTGRVYLEPQHPVYYTGEKYLFSVYSVLEADEGLIVSLLDCFNNMVRMSVNEDYAGLVNERKQILARIVNIKKGIPELTTV